jgi:predicted choloylglycine hydrolase
MNHYRTTLVFAAALLAVAAAAHAPHAVAAPKIPAYAESTVANGSLKLVDGVPVVRIWGTARERGTALGQLVKPQVEALYNHYLADHIASNGGEAFYLKAAEAFEPHLTETWREEIRGLADAIGRTYEEVRLAQVFLDIWQGQQCSCLAVSRERSASGEVVLARNLDFLDRGVLHKLSILLIVKHSDAEKKSGARDWIAPSWPGMLGALSGMNSDGLSVCTMVVSRPGDAVKEGIPYTLLYRKVLEETATVDDAVATLKAAKRAASNNLMIADAKGDAKVAEYTADQLATRTFDGGVVAATNYFESKEMPGNSVIGKERYLALRGYAKLHAGKLDDRDLLSVMNTVAIPFMCVQSMRFYPESRRLDLAIGGIPATKRPFVRFDKDALFGDAPAAEEEVEDF